MKKLKGTLTALVTPFREGEIDTDSLERLIDHQLRHGIEGFVVNGTTAESPTLDHDERERLFRVVKKAAGDQIPIVLGTGTNSTAKTVTLTKWALEMGADAALVVVPYYNKPPQRGLVEHFKKVAEVGLPVLLYNVPGRTITSMSLETVVELSRVPGIIGIKEASGDIEFAKKIRAACPPDFILLSGDDGTYDGFLKAGGDGVISVASHILPAEFAAWTRAARQKDFTPVTEGLKRYKSLIDLLFIEANPIPVKKALQFMTLLDSAELRLPLMEMDPELANRLRQDMVKCALLR